MTFPTSLARFAADIDAAVLRLETVTGMPAEWCRALILREAETSAVSALETAKRMAAACAKGQSELDSVYDRFTLTTRWWSLPYDERL